MNKEQKKIDAQAKLFNDELVELQKKYKVKIFAANRVVTPDGQVLPVLMVMPNEEGPKSADIAI